MPDHPPTVAAADALLTPLDSHPEPCKILVVDDEPDFELLLRQKFRKQLRSREWHFLFANDGVEALEAFRQNEDLDFVLTDINMPRMDGLTLLERLREEGRVYRAVVVSAYGDMRNIRTAMNRGAFDFVTKPIDFEDLEATIRKTVDDLTTVRRALESQRRLDALQRELEVAHNIQEAVLLQQFPVRDEIDLHAYMATAREVGGDFYDFFFLDENRLGLVVADVSGKGLTAAMFMAVCRTLLRGTALHSTTAAECIRAMNRLLYPQSLPQMFVTVFYGILDLDTGRFDYCNAGHHPPFLCRGGTVEPLPRTPAMAVALTADFDFGGHEIQLHPDDALLFFTDGAVEALNQEREQYDIDRLEGALQHAECEEETGAGIIRGIVRSLAAFTKETPQTDDITLMALRFLGADERSATEKPSPDTAETKRTRTAIS